MFASKEIKRPVGLLLFVAYLWLIWDGLLGPLYALFSERIGSTILDTAGAVALYGIVSGCLHLLFGKISDSLMIAKRIMLGGYILAAIATFGYLIVINPTGLFIIQIILGVANAMSSSTWDGIYSKSIKKENSVFMWSLVEGGYAIIYGVSTFVGGIIVTLLSFEILFIVMGSIMIFASVAIWYIQEIQYPKWK